MKDTWPWSRLLELAKVKYKYNHSEALCYFPFVGSLQWHHLLNNHVWTSWLVFIQIFDLQKVGQDPELHFCWMHRWITWMALYLSYKWWKMADLSQNCFCVVHQQEVHWTHTQTHGHTRTHFDDRRMRCIAYHLIIPDRKIIAICHDLITDWYLQSSQSINQI